MGDSDEASKLVAAVESLERTVKGCIDGLASKIDRDYGLVLAAVKAVDGRAEALERRVSALERRSTMPPEPEERSSARRRVADALDALHAAVEDLGAESNKGA